MDERKLNLLQSKARKLGFLDYYGEGAIRLYTNALGVLYLSDDPILLAKLIFLARHYEDRNESGMHVAIMEKCNYFLPDGHVSDSQLWDYDYQVLRDHPKATIVSMRDWLIKELSAKFDSYKGSNRGVAKKFLRWQSGNFVNLKF